MGKNKKPKDGAAAAAPADGAAAAPAAAAPAAAPAAAAGPASPAPKGAAKQPKASPAPAAAAAAESAADGKAQGKGKGKDKGDKKVDKKADDKAKEKDVTADADAAPAAAAGAGAGAAKDKKKPAAAAGAGAGAKTAAILSYDTARPPLAALATIELAAPSVAAAVKVIGKDKHATSLHVPATRDQLTGGAILRYLARLSDATGATKLAGDDALTTTQVDAFVELAAGHAAADTAKFAKTLNALLTTRTFLVTHHLTLADLAVYEALKGAGFAAAADVPHTSRWFNYLESLPAIKKAGASVAKVVEKAKAVAEHSASGGSFNIPLPGAEIGKMCTRFPPEPSGYLHIGHAKAAMLNNYFAREWKGSLILRFDDTNPGKEKQEYVDNILADLTTLEIKWDRLTHTSDYFQQCQNYAVQLIKDGKAYCDNTPVEQLRKERGEGIDSKCRDQTVEQNLEIFNEMLKGTPDGKTYVLRAKIGMQLANKCLRDPALYRCNDTPHHRTKDKFKAYPTYDFACPIVDSIEGVTHCLRTSEYHDRNEQYNWVLDALKLKHRPHIWDYSRLSFVYTLMSKRKLQWFVDNGIVENWNDPRFPTVQGMMRRGLTVPALREFILSQGASKAITTQEWDKVWTINKYYLDPIVPRYTAVHRDNKVEFRLTGTPKEYVGATVPLVPKDKTKGNKVILQGPVIYIEQEDAALIADGEEVTLMAWGNAVAERVVKDKNTGRVAYVEGRLNLAGNVKTTSKKLTWIAAGTNAADLVPCTLVEFDHLITKKLLEKGEDHKQFLNKVTKYETPALGEPAMRVLNKGDTIQLQRRGFYKVDQPFISAQRPMVLFFVPDGKAKAMSLLGNAKK